MSNGIAKRLMDIMPRVFLILSILGSIAMILMIIASAFFPDESVTLELSQWECTRSAEIERLQMSGKILMRVKHIECVEYRMKGL